MKTLLSTLLLTGLLLNAGCSSKKDSNAVAEEVNDKRIDDADSAQTETMAADSKGDTKDVAEYMIALSNSGMTEYEMSKIASEGAANQAIKEYARKIVEDHAKDDEELKAQATLFKITLPSTLSEDGKTMIAQLREEKHGLDFDRKYLDDMASVNDMAMGKAKSLASNADSPGVKNFAQKIIADDQKHMDTAKRLKETLD